MRSSSGANEPVGLRNEWREDGDPSERTNAARWKRAVQCVSERDGCECRAWGGVWEGRLTWRAVAVWLLLELKREATVDRNFANHELEAWLAQKQNTAS